MEELINKKNKPPNTLIFALSESNAIDAIRKLHEDKVINICDWLGTDKGQGVITYDFGTLLSYDIQKRVAETCPPEIYDKVYVKLYRSIDFLTRIKNIPTYEYVNEFNLLINFYYGLFKKKKIELLIFGDSPHFGVDSIAKDLADAMEIKTVLFNQALEPNHFFAYTNINDRGVFDTLPNDEKFKIILDEKFEKDLCYMKECQIEKPTLQNSYQFSCLSLARRIWNNRFDLYRKGIIHLLKKLEFFAFRHREEFVYKKNVQDQLNKMNVDLDCKFVYFPLHKQPEMSTSLIGGEFCDQILAIERLRQMLPDDWIIYVKENPKQSYYMRDELFFRRLSLISNTFLVAREINTYDLIAKSQFVATICGTVGWEAISGNKCALVFGLAWYRKLPGVFEYSTGVTVDEIVNYKIDHKMLNDKYNELMRKSYVGVLECGWEEAVAGYNDRDNNKYLYHALANIVDKIMSKGEEKFHEAVNC